MTGEQIAVGWPFDAQIFKLECIYVNLFSAGSGNTFADVLADIDDCGFYVSSTKDGTLKAG
jgi:hypothetical protein